jgi:hypothetical protein
LIHGRVRLEDPATTEDIFFSQVTKNRTKIDIVKNFRIVESLNQKGVS